MRILSTDQLNNLHSSELKSLFLDVRSRINRLKRSRTNEKLLTELEVYYCYIFRSLENK